MGKTREALRRAEEEYQQNLIGRVRGPLPEMASLPRKEPSNNHYIEFYESLKTNLLSRYPPGSLKCILFNGTNHGDGTTTTAVNFATALAKDSKFKVLLLEVNLRTPILHEVFKIGDAMSLPDVVKNICTVEAPVRKVGPGELYVIAGGCSRLFTGHVGFFESGEFDLFLKGVRERFDYVIVDSPPVPLFAEFRVLCSKVDGVVLVLNARITRSQVALKAKKELEAAGGKILGMVINRRKYYIPEWIYKRL